jgi:transcriptional regulator with XRE-family HTH domain
MTSEVSDFGSSRSESGAMQTSQRTVGDVLRTWRRRRHLSQLDLASITDVSGRHLSFIETGRSLPSREMLLRLADGLDLPLRERNALLAAGGYTPIHTERSWRDPEFQAVRNAVSLVLTGHEPHPALAVDRGWNLIEANSAASLLLSGVDPHLLTEPVNVLRLLVHPDGLVDQVVNRGELFPVLLARLDHELAVTGDERLEVLRQELCGYPAMRNVTPGMPRDAGIVVPFILRLADRHLRFISTTTVFGTANDVTVEELTIESFFPADEVTAAAMRSLLAT